MARRDHQIVILVLYFSQLFSDAVRVMVVDQSDGAGGGDEDGSATTAPAAAGRDADRAARSAPTRAADDWPKEGASIAATGRTVTGGAVRTRPRRISVATEAKNARVSIRTPTTSWR